MNSPSHIAFPFALLVALLLSAAIATAQNEIVENPQGAAKLQRIWYKLGGGARPTMGRGGGKLPEINGDKYGDFAFRNGSRWEVFLGGDPPADAPVWIFDSANYADLSQPVVGDFFGNGDTLIGFGRFRVEQPSNPSRGYTQLLFFRRNASTLLEGPVLTWDAGVTMNPPVRTYPNAAYAADLDGDGDDELVIVLPVLGRTPDTDTRTEIWIFRGGPEFSLAEPTLIVKDGEENDGRAVSASVVDVDGDGKPDLALGVNYRSIPKLKFWWGSEGGPWNWTDTPDRVLEQPGGTIRPGFGLSPTLVDFNGDSVMDRVGNLYWTDSSVFFLWLSGPDHDPRTRPFDSTDVNLILEDQFGGGTFGYVADSLRRYHMMSLSDPPLQARDLYGLAGGPDGPNLTYDAWLAGGESPLGGGQSAGDVNGDGWEDRIIASETYGGPGVGIALIIAGGSYIPNDDPSSAVREEPIAGEAGGLYLWPNPVADELHVAWKGNLKKMPARLTVHDVAGRLVVEGEVNPWRGEALWRCASVPAGTYLLTVYDAGGAAIATATVIRQ